MTELEQWQKWVGRSETREDVVTAQKVQAFNATIGGDLLPPQPGDPAPPAFHWCLAPRVATLADVGLDGHPERGDFLPPISLPRRMWAGGEIEFLAPLRIGEVVTRRSNIACIDGKQGRSGPLCFVRLTHELSVEGDIRIRERQDIVYRQAARGETVRPEVSETGPEPFETEEVFNPSPILLFRYSALTLNSHRIHYDRDYATRVEFYPGLVIQGPLQATLLLHHAAYRAGRPPRRFAHRAQAPLFDGTPFWVRSAKLAGDRLSCWSGNESAPVAMTAEASW